MKLTVIEIDPKKKYIMSIPEIIDSHERREIRRGVSDWLDDPKRTVLFVFGEVQLVKVSEE